jgi:sulfonate transport system substrate-binding protein
MVDVAPIGVGPAARRYVQNYGGQGARLIDHGGARDDLVDLYVRDETLEDAGKAAALRIYVRYWVKAEDWISAHPDAWAKLYYEGDQGLSASDARYAVEAAGQPDFPERWDQAIAREQAAIDLLARVTRNKPFAAASLFDRRFEPLVAAAAAEDRNPRLASR